MVASALTTALAIAVVAGGVYLVQHPQPIVDQVTVWQYEPPNDIASHAQRLKLTDHGRFLYYASTPQVYGSDSFAAHCPAHEGEDGFGILGCYKPADKTIYLYDVTDERLDGTEEITAAHEMLHAAWDRMGVDERETLTTLLEAEFQKHSDDADFAKRMAIYAKIEPGEHANELHSIVGTELAEISPELEDYYSQYFVDRGVVTSLHASANAVFVELKERSADLLSQLDNLRTSIEADYARYTDGYDKLSADIERFNARAQTGDFVSSKQFDREKATLLTRQSDLDALYDSVKTRSTEFDTMKTELESLNALNADLQRGLNIGGKVDVEGAG